MELLPGSWPLLAFFTGGDVRPSGHAPPPTPTPLPLTRQWEGQCRMLSHMVGGGIHCPYSSLVCVPLLTVISTASVIVLYNVLDSVACTFTSSSEILWVFSYFGIPPLLLLVPPGCCVPLSYNRQFFLIPLCMYKIR